MGLIKDLRNRFLAKKEAQPKETVVPAAQKKTSPDATGTSKKAVKKSTLKTEKKPDNKSVRELKKVSPYPHRGQLLLRPVVTEKSARLGEKNNQYVFEVPVAANKVEIRKAIEDRYRVKPLKVRTVRHGASFVRFGRYEGTTKQWKKAIVTLKKKETIDVFESSS